MVQKGADDGTARQAVVHCERSPASRDAPTVCRRAFVCVCESGKIATGGSNGERRATSYPPKSTPFCAVLILLRMGAPRPL